MKENLKRGNLPKRPQLTPLSKEESKLRRPLSPEILMDALQDSIHQDIGRSKVVKIAVESKQIGLNNLDLLD